MKWQVVTATYAFVVAGLAGISAVWIGGHFERERNSLATSMASCENRTALCPYKNLKIERAEDGTFKGFQLAFRHGRGGVIFDTYNLGETFNTQASVDRARTTVSAFVAFNTPPVEAFRRIEIVGHSDLFAIRRWKADCETELSVGPQVTLVQPLTVSSPDSCLARLRAIEFAAALRTELSIRAGDEEQISFSNEQFMLSTDRMLDGLLNEAFELVSFRKQLLEQARVDLNVPSGQVPAPEEFERWLYDNRVVYEKRLRPLRSVVALVTECYTERCIGD